MSSCEAVEGVVFTLLANLDTAAILHSLSWGALELHSAVNWWNWWLLRRPFLMQMCANRKHCSSARFSVSVTPLCAGLFLVPLREMFPFKCYLSVSFKTSSFPFDKQPEEMARAGSLSKPFSYQASAGKERERERCSAGASLRRLCSCLFFCSPPLRGWVILWWEVMCAFSPYSLFLWQNTGDLLASARFLFPNSTCI